MKRSESFSMDVMAFHDEVTGSCLYFTLHLPQNTKKHFLIECGLYQETKYQHLNALFEFKPEELNFVALTHNHIDHTGRVPLLIAKGFEGPIFVSEQTVNLLPISMKDCFKIMKANAKVTHTPVLYTGKDIGKTISKLHPLAYDATYEINENVSITLLGNGHLLGAACILIQATCYGHPSINCLITGDYAAHNTFFHVTPIPTWVTELPNLTLIQESTYGATSVNQTICTFDNDIETLCKQSRTILIPSIAAERIELILNRLKKLQQQGRLDINIPIIIDTPLGINYLWIYYKNTAIDFLPENIHLVDTKTRDDYINLQCPKIIITASGMLDKGTSPLYLAHEIENPDSVIYLTCYQVADSLGNRLLQIKEGNTLKILGNDYVKKATVLQTNEFSSHARQEELLAFLTKFKHLTTLLVTHGEHDAKKSYISYVSEHLPTLKRIYALDRHFYYNIESNGHVSIHPTKFANQMHDRKKKKKTEKEKPSYIRRNPYYGRKYRPINTRR